MSILITGGLGFVGIHLAHHLAAQGERIVCADLLAPDEVALDFLTPVAERVRIVYLNVTDRAAVWRLVQAEETTTIVHAAAVTPDVRREWTDPTPIVDANLGGTLNVLDAVTRGGPVERVLFVSSSGVYGTPGGNSTRPQAEDGPLCLDTLYSITKYSSELLAARYAQITGKAIAAVRLAAAYGPMERPTGSRERMSEPRQLLDALRAGRRVRVAGPSISRDWTYVADITAALGALLRAPRWNCPLYNVGCGRAVAFREVVAAFERHGLRVDWVEEGGEADIRMQPGQERAPLDISRLTAETGFTPRYDIGTGVTSYLRSEAAVLAGTRGSMICGSGSGRCVVQRPLPDDE